ncbi:MAG: ankyrin repeat domain-containing protein [Hydrogenophilales bacterium]|nr:ankyrin repeat domain-containing protein [Hydrogenophilales bacterium]
MKHEKSFRRIDAATASELLGRDDVRVFDSRDEARFERAHIAGAQRLSAANLDATLLGTPKTVPVLLVCYHGNASQTYGQMFADFGFAEVYSLDGGFAAWQRLQRKTAPPVLGPQLAQWLQQHGYPDDDPDAVAEHGMTPLMRASKLGDTETVFELLQAGASLDATNADGNNALWLACVGESLDAMDVLIRAGIDLDHQNDNGATCLMVATSTGKHAVVDMLLASGADPRLTTLDDFSALDMAATIECLRLLRSVEKEMLQMVG